METMNDVRAELARVEAEITMIYAQLEDPTRREDKDWKRRATYARAHLIREQKQLKARLATMDAQRQAEAREARAQRQTAAQEERARKEAVLLSATQEMQLILKLTIALGRLYRKVGLRATPEDAVLLEYAASYCEDKGLFE